MFYLNVLRYIQRKNENEIYPIVSIEPIADQDVKLAIGPREWNRDQFWTVDSN